MLKNSETLDVIKGGRIRILRTIVSRINLRDTGRVCEEVEDGARARGMGMEV